MGYIDRDYYDIYHPDNEIVDFDMQAERASEIIDKVALNRISMFGFDSFSEFTQARIKKATAAQVDLLDGLGGYESVLVDDGTSFRLGNFSAGSSTKSNKSSCEIPISPLVHSYLLPTNLLNRAVRIRTINNFI